MTPTEWKEVEAKLSHPYGVVRLTADGVRITAEVQPAKGLRYCIAVFIDGKIDWNLCHDKEPGDARKFWRPTKRFLYPAKERAEALAQANKRGMPAEIKKSYQRLATASMEYLSPTWPNAKAWCRHLRKHCTSIEQVPDAFMEV